jgi:hypothetical protein
MKGYPSDNEGKHWRSEDDRDEIGGSETIPERNLVRILTKSTEVSRVWVDEKGSAWE